MASQNNANSNRDIHELNLAYLFCIREMARRDVAETALRFGIDQSLVQALADSTLDKIRAIADPSMLQFKMRASTQVRSLLKNEEGGPSSLLNAVNLIAEAAGNE